MEISELESVFDNCRRFGAERRIYGYDAYLPERRVDDERRSGEDRRKNNLGHTIVTDRRLSDS